MLEIISEFHLFIIFMLWVSLGSRCFDLLLEYYSVNTQLERFCLSIVCIIFAPIASSLISVRKLWDGWEGRSNRSS